MADWNSVGEHSNGPSKCAGTTCVNAHRLSSQTFLVPFADFLFASRGKRGKLGQEDEPVFAFGGEVFERRFPARVPSKRV